MMDKITEIEFKVEGHTCKFFDDNTAEIRNLLDLSLHEADWSIRYEDHSDGECAVVRVVSHTLPIAIMIMISKELMKVTGADTRELIEGEV